MHTLARSNDSAKRNKGRFPQGRKRKAPPKKPFVNHDVHERFPLQYSYDDYYEEDAYDSEMDENDEEPEQSNEKSKSSHFLHLAFSTGDGPGTHDLTEEEITEYQQNFAKTHLPDPHIQLCTEKRERATKFFPPKKMPNPFEESML